MRPIRLTLFLCCIASPVAALAQTPPRGASCGVRPAQPPTEADRAFAAGNYSEAVSLYSRVPTPVGTIGVVHSLLQQNKLPEALVAAQSAASASPADADLQALLGEALLRDGEIAAATTPLSKALTLDHCSPRALYGLAIYNQLISKRASAAAQLATAHKLAPGDAQITAAWAMTLPLTEQPAALKPLLAASPTLPVSEITHLSTALAIAEGNHACTASWPDKPVVEDLHGLMVRGTHARSYGLSMHVGPANLSTVELDSGVTGIVLNPHDAKSAGVRPLPGTPAQPSGMYYAVADVIRVGPAEFHDCPVRVAPAQALAGANSLIGTDFFRDRLIHLDYINRTVTFSAPATPAGGLSDRTVPPAEKDWAIAYFAGSNILLPTLINSKGPFLMLLDTGAYVSIYAPLIGDHHAISFKDTLVPVRGSSTDIVKLIPQYEGGDFNDALIYGPTGKLLTVSIPIRQPDIRFYGNDRLDIDPLSIDITPKSQDTGIELSGLLGFSVLKDFTIDIDYRNGLIHLVYDQLHRYAERELVRQN